MSFIEVYFNSSLQDTIEINTDTVSIGRAAHNQIQINNKGVSLLHAVITKKDKDWFVEDLNSTNGTYLNGVKIEGRQIIKFGDNINIGKYDLMFVSTRTQVAITRNVTQTDDADRTILVHSNRREQTETIPKTDNCYLLVHGEKRNINKLLLNRDSYTIGKGKENDLLVGGWFTPRLIAEISRLGNNYYLSPITAKQLVEINGRKLVSRVKLSNDDNITIKKLSLKFVEE